MKKTKQMKRITLLLCLCVIGLRINAQSSIEQSSNHVSALSKQSKTEQKRDLTPEDYKLWEDFESMYLSNDGSWYTYFKYNNKDNTLYLTSTTSTLEYNFPFAGNHQFNAESTWFACLTYNKGLGLLQLETGKTQWISDVTKFDFSSDGNYLVYTKTNQSNNLKSSELIIHDLKAGELHIVDGVRDYLLSHNTGKLAYIQDIKGHKAVKLIGLSQSESITVTQNISMDYKHLVWNIEGTALAFLQEISSDEGHLVGYKIFCYETRKNRSKLYSLDPVADGSIFPGRQIMYDQFKLKFSRAGKHLYFKVRGAIDIPEPVDNMGVDVVVLNAKDKGIFTKDNRKLASWHPETGSTTVLESNTLPKAIVSNNGEFMLSYDPSVYEPSFAVYGNNDIYLTDLKTGASGLLLKKYGGKVFISPNSKYISYFRDRHWWVYDVEEQVHINVTKELPVTWHKDFPIHPHKNGLIPYGAPGWTKDDKQLIVYDKYDIWSISPKGKAQKLTEGRSSKISHRIYSKGLLYKGQIKSQVTIGGSGLMDVMNIGREVDLSEGLILEIKGADKASGYSIWTPGKKPKILIYKPMRITSLLRSKNTNIYTYVEESFKVSPRVVCLNASASEPQVLVETNGHQNQFHWGDSELVHYKGPKGEDLQGALFYPANYKLGESYPMIVEIYEKRSDLLHYYQNPTEYNMDRLNPTNYTTSGYFFFYPDITPNPNNTGMSAVHCVEAGVKAVIAKGIVDEKHIGLTGHSFGGYETNFIITQSNLFATAVAGAGVSDIVSFYHMGFIKNLEDFQYNLRGSFYENPEVYLRNSPIHHAANINTPLLLWAGKNDGAVDYRQSYEMYYALRRLNKTCEFLFYPDEGHHINKPKNQVYQTRRIKAWFDKYLKPTGHTLLGEG